MSLNRKWYLTGLVLLSVSTFSPLPVLAEKYPVYRLAGPRVDQAKAGELVKAMGGAPKPVENEHASIQRSGQKVVEIDKRSGHIFLGDMERLWNPKRKPTLPERARAKELADSFLKEHKLLPTDQRVKVAFSHYSESVGGQDSPGNVDRQLLDREVNYRVDLSVRGSNGKERTLPVVGGGAKFQVSLGDQGSVIGFQGGWRQIAGIKSQEEISTQASAEAEFRKRFGGVEVKNVEASLAYYAAPAFEEQTELAPVWVVKGEIQVGAETIPARSAIIPATKYGPKLEQGPASKSRAPNQPPPKDLEPGDEKPPSQGMSWRDLPGWLDDALFPKAYASPGYECGTEWIGTSQGLSGSAGNRQGFIDQCRAAGWSVSFDWGDYAAWERDWRVNDDVYVDSVDLVFYTGHASPSGWVLNSPDDTFLRYSEVGSSPGSDLYGNNDLEWLIIAACGPLQSTHFTTNTTNAFDRWRGIFDGLHVLLGYGAVTYDNTSEGRRFMELARAGWNVIDAWFRTAKEIQPSTNGWSAPNGPNIYVVAMYAHNGDHCARNDHLWGMGTVCGDVTGSAQQRYILWSGT